MSSEAIGSLAAIHSTTLLGLAFFRGAPIAGYVLVSGRFSPIAKLLAIVCAACAFILALCGDSLFRQMPSYMVLVAAYFVAVVGASIATRRALCRLGSLTRFVALATVFVLIPGMLPGHQPRALAVAVGWEMLLASHSTLSDAYRTECWPSPAEHAFFVLVNPVLVYAERGAEITPYRLAPLLRSFGGLGAILLGRLIGASALAVSPIGFDPLGMAIAATTFVAAYSQHSGLASMQIGLMRFVGHEIPERYSYPLAARSPLDFWRRWNTYVGSWAQRYVFTPLSLRLARTRLITFRSATGLALVATFLCIGILHELGTFAMRGAVSGHWCIFFLSNAIMLLLWEWSRGLWRQSSRLPPRFRSAAEVLWRGLDRLATLFVILLSLLLMAHVARLLVRS